MSKPAKSVRRDRANRSTVPEAFGERLRAARRGQGLTLKDVSDRSGTSIAYLSDLERGLLRNPTLDTLTGLAGALSVSLNDLLGLEEPDHHMPLPAALAEFARLPEFRKGVAIEAEARGVSPETVRTEWLRCLGDISVFGERPKTASDYMFLWETMRRVLRG